VFGSELISWGMERLVLKFFEMCTKHMLTPRTSTVKFTLQSDKHT